MFKRFLALTFSAALSAYAGDASAAELCQAPGPPPDQGLRPVAPIKPAIPSCASSATRADNCRPAVIKAYNANVDAYNTAMIKFNADGNAYIDALNQWARSGVAYANCEIQRLNREAVQ